MPTKGLGLELCKRVWLAGLALVLGNSGAWAQFHPIIYVDARIEAPGDGRSWATACLDLQDALGRVSDQGEIRVAQGTYSPSMSSRRTPRSIEIDTTNTFFDVYRATIVKGGYGGICAADPNVRNPERFPTILSGDPLGNDQITTASQLTTTSPWRADNSKILLYINAPVTLDGVTIEAATYTGCQSQIHDLITFRNCNGSYDTEGFGGAISAEQLVSLRLEHCTFEGNVGLEGGALAVQAGELQIRDSRLAGNVARERGGSIVYSGARMVCEDTLFINNESLEQAGAMGSSAEEVFIDRCRFLANAAQNGSICQFDRGHVVLSNSLFSGNLIVGSGAVVAASRLQGSGLTFAHNQAPSIVGNEISIFWNNVEHDMIGVTPTYSCVQHVLEGDGVGCIHSDPLFADPNGGDYHLMSTGGRYVPDYTDWARDIQSSPCIGMGDPNSTLGDQLGQYSNRVNMGAYGATAHASRLTRHVPIVFFEDLINGALLYTYQTLTVQVSDMDGQVIAVEFLLNGQRLGLDVNREDGWSIDAQGLPEGQAVITAKAIDDHGLIGQTSLSVTVVGSRRTR